MDILHRWKSWIRPACLTFYIICLMIALPLCIIELNRKGAPDHVQAWFIGGLFVMLALPISFWGILQHLVYYTQPHLQRHIIRVLWMVPIYALNAWFALRFPPAAIYLDTLRECYEAYVIYNFMRYLLNFLHQEHPQLDLLLENKPRVKHFFPFCCLPPWPTGRIFLNRCKHGVLQYTVVRPAMTVVALLSELAGKYGEGDFNFTTTWSYIVIINNVSQLVAMYCLVLFYKATKEELAPIKPLPKFLCVKAVVFVSFWQSTVIAALAKLNVIPSNGTWVFYENIQQVATGLQDFLICLEMFLAAIAHYYSFSHLPFADDAASRANCCTTFWSMWDVRDVRDDVIDHARYISRGVQKKFGKGKTSERTPLLSSQDTSVTVHRNSHSIQRPSTPPVMVEEKQHNPGMYDSQSLTEADWEKSTESFHVKSTTPSMNNYAEFSNSVEVNQTGQEEGFAEKSTYSREEENPSSRIEAGSGEAAARVDVVQEKDVGGVTEGAVSVPGGRDSTSQLTSQSLPQGDVSEVGQGDSKQAEGDESSAQKSSDKTSDQNQTEGGAESDVNVSGEYEGSLERGDSVIA